LVMRRVETLAFSYTVAYICVPGQAAEKKAEGEPGPALCIPLYTAAGALGGAIG
jgi:hypothetical protein